MDGPIVVGTDGSVTARRAVAASIELAVRFGQPLHVVYGYPVDPAREPGMRPEWRVPSTAPSWACAVLAEAESRASEAGARVTTHGRFGRGSDAIIDVADAVGAALIVVGDRGLRSKARFVLGNVPNAVVHLAPCSVHLVRTS